jgi:hypothetical protein
MSASLPFKKNKLLSIYFGCPSNPGQEGEEKAGFTGGVMHVRPMPGRREGSMPRGETTPLVFYAISPKVAMGAGADEPFPCNHIDNAFEFPALRA